MPVINCATTSLDPFIPSTENTWNLQKSLHLTRRTILGASFQEQQSLLDSSPSEVVDYIMDQGLNKGLSDPPIWAYWGLNDYEDLNSEYIDQILEWATVWLKGIGSKNLRNHLSFFWHNHFVARLDDYNCPSWMYQYHRVLEKNALGNLKEFVREIGITPAMLVFLNGAQSTKADPNENYARELYELFTLGVDNGYTQQDIEETARALTGYNLLQDEEYCNQILFTPFTHDNEEKTIFGQTGNWGYDDVIDILFEENGPLIAKHICDKLYKYFVNPDPSIEIIEQMADIMVFNDYEIEPVLRTLFKSQHFFDEANIGVFIPGHIELFLTTANELNCPISDEDYLTILTYSSEIGQYMFNPVDVAGWQGNRNWISTNVLTLRWNFLTYIIYSKFENEPDLLRDFAIELTQDSNDPRIIATAILNYFLPKGVQFENDIDNAVVYLKSEIPENYFQDGSWSLHWDTAPAQLTLLLFYIVNLPEFQLK